MRASEREEVHYSVHLPNGKAGASHIFRHEGDVVGSSGAVAAAESWLRDNPHFAREHKRMLLVKERGECLLFEIVTQPIKFWVRASESESDHA